MEDISNKTLALLVGVAVILSVSAVYFTQQNVVSMTGMATATGQGNVSLNITGTASINVTGNIDFGSGSHDAGAEYAYLNSKATAAEYGTWTYAVQNISVVNDGNTNLSLEIESSKNASGLLGGTGTYLTGFEFLMDEAETGACVSGIANGSTFADGDFTNYQPDTKLVVCDDFSPFTSSNELHMSVNLTVPKDAIKDVQQTATITFTGTY